MSAILYVVTYRSAGDPTAATGLTPTWTAFQNAADGTDLSVSAPAVAEIGSGHYRFILDWDDPAFVGVDTIVFVLAGGLGVPAENYITGRIDRWDLDSKLAADAAYGEWHITGNQLNMYDRLGNLIQAFDLYDSLGAPTEFNPARRDPV